MPISADMTQLSRMVYTSIKQLQTIREICFFRAISICCVQNWKGDDMDGLFADLRK